MKLESLGGSLQAEYTKMYESLIKSGKLPKLTEKDIVGLAVREYKAAYGILDLVKVPEMMQKLVDEKLENGIVEKSFDFLSDADIVKRCLAHRYAYVIRGDLLIQKKNGPGIEVRPKSLIKVNFAVIPTDSYFLTAGFDILTLDPYSKNKSQGNPYFSISNMILDDTQKIVNDGHQEVLKDPSVAEHVLELLKNDEAWRNNLTEKLRRNLDGAYEAMVKHEALTLGEDEKKTVKSTGFDYRNLLTDRTPGLHKESVIAAMNPKKMSASQPVSVEATPSLHNVPMGKLFKEIFSRTVQRL